MSSRCLACAILLVAVAITSAAHPQPSRARKVLVAHRGASAYAPEHTREAYELGVAQGADYIEQDLGVTRDGVLVSLHDGTLQRTTNVEEVFPDRAVEVDGVRGWYLRDFTLAEIRRLDAGSWFDARFAGARVATWDEAVAIARGRAGLYPELKRPELYGDRGIDVVRLLADSLRSHGLDRPAGVPRTPVIVQSFDAATLRRVAVELPALPRVLLIEAADAARWLTPEGLRTVATFATGIGPAKAALLEDPCRVALAHAAGLTVHPYTFRSRSPGRFASVREEMAHYLFSLGVDGLFTDNPDEFPR